MTISETILHMVYVAIDNLWNEHREDVPFEAWHDMNQFFHAYSERAALANDEVLS
jgi:hypothetical protein